MNLYQANLSPFASRVRMQVYAKGLDEKAIRIVPPPGGTGSAEYRSINPTGKIPALDTGQRVLPESEVICEYLEDTFSEPRLRPTAAIDRAQVRLLGRLVDLYLYPRMAPLYGQIDPSRRDPAQVEQGLKNADEGLELLAQLLESGGYRTGPFAVGDSLTLADCALVPMLFFVDAVMPLFSRTRPFAAAPRVEGYWLSAAEQPIAQRVLGEMRVALTERMRAGAG